MKIKLHTIFLAVFAFLTGSVLFTMSSSAEIIGQVDWVTETYLEGYAWDTEAPVSLNLTLQIKKQDSTEPVKTIQVNADQYRSDLPSVSNDNGYHSFHLPMDWTEFEDGIYSIELYYLDQLVCEPVSYTHGDVSTQEETSKTNSQNSSSHTSLGTFKITGYCPCYQCSEGWGRHTSTGAIASSNHTIAVDPNVIPYGTQVVINGITYTAEDRGGGVKGKHIDIFYDTHAEIMLKGTHQAEVFLLS